MNESQRTGRCGRCKYCLVVEDKDYVRARCTLYPHTRVEGRVIQQHCHWWINTDEAKKLVLDACDRLMSPIWCPLDIEEFVNKIESMKS